MQMIWSAALIEHGWSGLGPVGSEVTVCHRRLALLRGPSTRPLIITSLLTTALMLRVIINAEIARHRPSVLCFGSRL